MKCVALMIAAGVVALPMAVGAQDHSNHQTRAATPSTSHDHQERAPPSKATTAEHPSSAAHAPAKHVPPDPPQHQMRDMSEEEMIDLMGMDDTSKLLFVRADSFEWRNASERDAFAWDIQGWYGGDYTKLWVKSEGEANGGESESRNELLLDHIIARWWSFQAGIRHDMTDRPARTWLAFGIQGLSPYWFEVEATAYVGEQGRTALRLSAEYEVLLTQRLVLQPEIELNAYGKTDEDNLIGQGLSDGEASLRVRYEFRREVAPYVGVAWQTHFGETADLLQEAGRERSELHWLAGVRWWF